jgi:hypothetical protein
MHEDLLHFAAVPFAALCGAGPVGTDQPGRRTTMILADVTCPECLLRRLSQAEAVIEAARRAVKGKGVISLAEWDALCVAVAEYDGEQEG